MESIASIEFLSGLTERREVRGEGRFRGEAGQRVRDDILLRGDVRCTEAHWVGYHEGRLEASEGATREGNTCTLVCPGFARRVIRQEEDDWVGVSAAIRGACSNGVVARDIINYDGGVLEDINVN